MKPKNRAYLSILFCFLGIISFRCEREDIPVINTNELKDIADITAVCGGSLLSDGGSGLFDMGVCWSKDNVSWNYGKVNFGSGDYCRYITKTYDSFDFYCSLTNLDPNTTYYVKAYATNRIGTGYGETISFTTISPLAGQINFNTAIEYHLMTDQEGNTYKTVTIGDQVWMAENLKAITFNDGESIQWDYGYKWYDNDVFLYKATYGALYSIGSILSGKLCPVGWHVPTINEWQILNNALGGSSVSGGKLKEAGTAHWSVPNSEATNESGFTALPGGEVDGVVNSVSRNMGSSGIFLTSTAYSPALTGVDISEFIELEFDTVSVFNMAMNISPFGSVRCVKD